ncbi:putative transposase, Ptta/En/Spm, plant [Dioscorea sansibarensis]
MVRRREHTTSSYLANSIEDSGHAMSPSSFVLIPQIDAQEHQEALMQPEQVEIVQENANAQVIRNRKRCRRFWNVLIREANGKENRERMRVNGIFKLPLDKRVVVEWNHRDQPIDESGGILSRFLGRIARDNTKFPIGYEKWSAIPHYFKDHVWNSIIKIKFEVNDAQHKNYIFKSLGKKWRDHRYNLYKFWKKDPLCPFRALKVFMRHPICSKELDDFINYRARHDTKTKATQNAENCRNLTMRHTLGSISFARLENEMKVGHGGPITRVELFQAGYTRANGSFVNEEAKKNHEELVIQSQTLSENEAFLSVFGKEHPGYVRSMGLGAVKTQIYGSSCSSCSKPYSSGPTQAEFDAMKETVQQLQEQIAILTQQQASQNPNLVPNRAYKYGVPSC